MWATYDGALALMPRSYSSGLSLLEILCFELTPRPAIFSVELNEIRERHSWKYRGSSLFRFFFNSYLVNFFLSKGTLSRESKAQDFCLSLFQMSVCGILIFIHSGWCSAGQRNYPVSCQFQVIQTPFEWGTLKKDVLWSVWKSITMLFFR